MAALAVLPVAAQSPAEDEVTGWWLQVDAGGHEPHALVLVYRWEGQVYGRLLFSLDRDGTVNDRWTAPRAHSRGVRGDPPLMGFDFIYQLQPAGREWQGQIMDPSSGDEYAGRLWRTGPNLVLRGQLKGIFGFLGQNQTWLPFNSVTAPRLWQAVGDGSETLPDPASIEPAIPQKK